MLTRDLILQRVEGALAAVGSIRDNLETIEKMGQTIVERLRAGGVMYTAGNGGSAAEALHLAEEFIGRYRSNRPPLRAVCLNADPTALTCIANDFGFEEVFARQIRALGSRGDIVVAFSTSGRSRNILRLLEEAGLRGCVRIALLGSSGGAARELCEHALIVPSDDSAHVQEAHQVVLHLFCELLETGWT